MLRNRTLPLHSALKPSSLHHYVAHKATWILLISAFILCVWNVNFFADTRHDVALVLYLIWLCGTLFFQANGMTLIPHIAMLIAVLRCTLTNEKGGCVRLLETLYYISIIATMSFVTDAVTSDGLSVDFGRILQQGTIMHRLCSTCIEVARRHLSLCDGNSQHSPANTCLTDIMQRLLRQQRTKGLASS